MKRSKESLALLLAGFAILSIMAFSVSQPLEVHQTLGCAEFTADIAGMHSDEFYDPETGALVVSVLGSSFALTRDDPACARNEMTLARLRAAETLAGEIERGQRP